MKTWVSFAASLLAAGMVLAQPPRPLASMQFDWWDRPILRNLELSEAQTKQLNDIRQAYDATLRNLYDAEHRAESNLNEIYNQDKADDLKASIAVDQYVNARDNLTRVLTEMSLKMRGVLTSDQWKQLTDLQAGRLNRGRGRGRSTSGSPQGSAPGRSGPAISQK